MESAFTFRNSWVCFCVTTGVLLLIAPISVPAQAQNIQWIRQFGATNGEFADFATRVAVDASGVYVVGYTFDGGTLPGQTSAGKSDVFVRKYDLNGNELWTRQFGSDKNEDTYGVAVDATGVYISGVTSGVLPGQNSVTSVTSRDAFLRKYDANGNEQWTRQFGIAWDDQAWGVAVDSSGVYVAGQGGDTTRGYDGFVRKYDANGNQLWTSLFRTPSGSDYASGVAVDASGVYIHGNTWIGGTYDAFVRKYDRSGNLIWTRQFGSVNNDTASGVSADATGVYISGITDGTLPGQTSAGSNGRDAFLRKYDINGNEQWTRQFGTAFDDAALGVAANAGSIYVVGRTNAGGAYQAFVKKYDVNGNELWNLTFGSPADDGAYGVAVNATGVYIAGYTKGSLPGQTSAGLDDAFVAKLDGGASILSYYLPHLALGGGWQTTITYVNYSPQTVTCETTFYSDSGAPLSVSFAGVEASRRTDTLAPGAVIHEESRADLNAPVVSGWAKVGCSAPIKASLLFRFYQEGKPTGEASVNATTIPATRFVTFADQNTGVAYANPFTQTAQITFTAISSLGTTLASKNSTLSPGAHGAVNVGPFLDLSSFSGSIQLESTLPIVSLSLNAEAFPVFSSLPPGDLGRDTLTYYFPHMALGAGWQTTLTYINYASQTVTCTTSFLSDSGAPLLVPFGGTASSRTDTLAPKRAPALLRSKAGRKQFVTGRLKPACYFATTKNAQLRERPP